MEVNVIFSFVLFFATSMISGQDTHFQNYVCTSPNNRSGTCVSVEDCPHIVHLLLTNRMTQEIRDLLRKSQCGWKESNAKICCGDTDVTNHAGLNLINDFGCGLRPKNEKRRRIVGGTAAQNNEFPWMALLVYNINQNTPGYLCSGSIINSRHILTAAHCVTNLPSGKRLIGVVVGVHDIAKYRECSTKGNCDRPYQEFAVEKVISHSEFSSQKLQNDIALIKLNRQINFASIYVQTICLSVGPEAETPNAFTLSGWGITEQRVQSFELLKVKLNRFSQNECANIYAKKHKEIWHKQMCAGGLQGVDACAGDSGGPLQAEHFYNNMYRTVQYGIVSFGTQLCGVADFPGVYTRINYYLDWILDNLRASYVEDFENLDLYYS